MSRPSLGGPRVRRAAGFAVAALVALALACVPLHPPRQPAVPLKVVIRPFLAFAPFAIAEQEGYFAEQGLAVETVAIERAADALPALVQGDLDVMAGGLSVGLLNAMARGAQIRLVAPVGSFGQGGCVNTALVARRELVESGQLNTPAGLKGRRIAFNRGNFERFQIETLLIQSGLAPDDVVAVDIPDNAELQALQQGAIDLAYSSEPILSQSLQTGDVVVWKPVQEIVPDFQPAFVVYGPNLLQRNPEVGERFATAYLKAVRKYREGKTDRNLEILATYTGLDRKVLEEICWPPFREDGGVNVQSVLDFQQWSIASGLLEQGVGEHEFWDPRFIEKANAALATPAT